MTEEASTNRREYMREYMRKYREAHREEVNASNRKWRHENKEKVIQYNCNYWEKKINEERGKNAKTIEGTEGRAKNANS